MSGLPDPTTGILYTNSGSGNEGFAFHNTWIDTYINAPNYYSSQDSNDITDVFNERKWFRVYVGNRTVTTARVGQKMRMETLTMDGVFIMNLISYIYLENLALPPGDITATGFNVTWDIETDTLPSAPSGITYEYTYKVTYSTSSEFTNGTTSEITAISQPTDPAVSAVTQALSNLSGNTNYYIKVSSSNTYETDNGGNNYYEYSIENDNDGNAILTKPPQVTGLSYGTVTGVSVALTWTPIGGEPFDTSETSNDGYTVEYSDDGGTSWTESDHHISTTSHTVTGLSSETSYQFRVKATNATGDGLGLVQLM